MKNFLSLVFALMLAAVSFSLPVSAEGCDHTIRKPFSADNTTLSGYHYLYLTEDTELSEALKIIRSTGNATYVNLCLNGYTLSLVKGAQGSVINCQDSTLYICDCSEKQTGTITGGNTVEINDRYSSQAVHNPGGGIHFDSGQLTIDGCTITGNKAVMGGGIHAGGHSSVQLNGTKLIGNESEYGSALYITATNHSGPYGLVLDGCTIRKNEGKSALSTSSPLLLKDTAITDNEGYGIRTSDDGSYVTITGNTVIRNNDYNLGMAYQGIVKVEEFTGPKKAIGVTYTRSKSNVNVLPFYGKDAIDITAPCDTDYTAIFFSDDKRFKVRSHPDSEYAIYQNVTQLYIPPHKHQYDEKWSSDQTYHWGVCYCGEEGPKQRHFPRLTDYGSNCRKCTRKYAEMYGEQPDQRSSPLLICAVTVLILHTAVFILFIHQKRKGGNHEKH